MEAGPIVIIKVYLEHFALGELTNRKKYVHTLYTIHYRPFLLSKVIYVFAYNFLKFARTLHLYNYTFKLYYRLCLLLWKSARVRFINIPRTFKVTPRIVRKCVSTKGPRTFVLLRSYSSNGGRIYGALP